MLVTYSFYSSRSLSLSLTKHKAIRKNANTLSVLKTFFLVPSLFLWFLRFFDSTMDKHKCKLCFRSFSNGRALGGHMRSHMMNLPFTRHEEESSRIQLSFEAESAASSSSSSEDEDGDDEKSLCYGLRENPKRSIRLVDPEFSFPATDTASVILQDRESETESSKNNPTRRRSKRAWKLGMLDSNSKYPYNDNNYNNNINNKKQDPDLEQESIMMTTTMKKKVKFSRDSKTEAWSYEPASSVSDATTEEDVAFCLMMLSRDKWRKQKNRQQLVEYLYEEEEEQEEDEYEEEEEEDDESERSLEESDESQETMKACKNRVRGRYKCETCNKVFKSYQALGGHRASHKKIKVNIKVDDEDAEFERAKKVGGVEKKIHECPVCFRVFASGQALGGHKRTHVTGSAATTTIQVPPKFANPFIDLNLPAPIDDDDVSQFENSAVSDAEFVKIR
ncbi:hypothetical protein RJT34_16235 [Clitoria ternatea]|uniref:C2H2-type domain-containing protein n=1 Tax=Clitoria ternatea TaxID=43366 RepID=A0AAN9J6U4_CLITE